MKSPAALLGLMACIASFTAFGEEPKTEKSIFFDAGFAPFIMNRTGYHIEFTDQVSDGCLPRPSNVREKIEVSMRRNGLSIIEKTPFSVFYVHALGFESGRNHCAVQLQASIKTFVITSISSSSTEYSTGEILIPVNYPIDSILLTGGKNSMQGRVEETAQDMADSLFLEIGRAKDHMAREFPEVYEALSK